MGSHIKHDPNRRSAKRDLPSTAPHPADGDGSLDEQDPTLDERPLQREQLKEAQRNNDIESEGDAQSDGESGDDVP
jgi:hypothetical protein